MSKQSSIEWLYDQMSNLAAGYATELNQQEILEKAKAMHRKETEHYGAMCCLRTTQKNQWSLEGLYNETFGGNK